MQHQNLLRTLAERLPLVTVRQTAGELALVGDQQPLTHEEQATANSLEALTAFAESALNAVDPDETPTAVRRKLDNAEADRTEQRRVNVYDPVSNNVLTIIGDGSSVQVTEHATWKRNPQYDSMAKFDASDPQKVKQPIAVRDKQPARKIGYNIGGHKTSTRHNLPTAEDIDNLTATLARSVAVDEKLAWHLRHIPDTPKAFRIAKRMRSLAAEAGKAEASLDNEGATRMVTYEAAHTEAKKTERRATIAKVVTAVGLTAAAATGAVNWHQENAAEQAEDDRQVAMIEHAIESVNQGAGLVEARDLGIQTLEPNTAENSTGTPMQRRVIEVKIKTAQHDLPAGVSYGDQPQLDPYYQTYSGGTIVWADKDKGIAHLLLDENVSGASRKIYLGAQGKTPNGEHEVVGATYIGDVTYDGESGEVSVSVQPDAYGFTGIRHIDRNHESKPGLGPLGP